MADDAVEQAAKVFGLDTFTVDVLVEAPASWRDMVGAPLTYEDGQRMVRELDALAAKAVRLSAYVNAAMVGTGDAAHARGVKDGNRVVRALRKALGYTVARDDVTF